MTIDITPLVGTFFNMILALIGIDFVWGGYWYMKTREIKRTRGLSYLTIKFFERVNRLNNLNKSSNQFAKRFISIRYSMDAVGIYLVVAGILLVIQGMFPLLTQLYR